MKRALKIALICICAIFIFVKAHAGTREEGIHRYEWEWQATPPYDIINRNIHVWVYKKDGVNYGFAITGHARAEVCEVASLEVFNTLSRLNLQAKDYLVAGTAYSTRAKKNTHYHKAIQSMLDKLKILAREKGEVHLHTVEMPDQSGYDILPILGELKDSGYTVILRYSMDENQGPLFLPYYYKDQNGDFRELSFTLRKNDIESLQEFFKPYRDSITNRATAIIDELQKLYEDQIASNQRKLELLKRLKENYLVLQKKLKRADEFASGITITGYSQADLDRQRAKLQAEFNQLERDIPALQNKAKELLNQLVINNRIDFYTLDKEFRQEYFRYPDDLDLAIEFGKEASQGLLDAIQKMANLKAIPKKRSLDNYYKAAIIESVIRDWPLSFSPKDIERVFDQYKERNRPVIWKFFNDQLKQKEIHLPGVEQEISIQSHFFNKENIVYLTDIAKDEYIIRPIFVTGGHFMVSFNENVNLTENTSAWVERQPEDRSVLGKEAFFKKRIQHEQGKILSIDGDNPATLHLPSLKEVPFHITTWKTGNDLSLILNVLKKPQSEDEASRIVASIKAVFDEKQREIHRVYLNVSEESQIRLDTKNNLYIDISADEKILPDFSEIITGHSRTIAEMLVSQKASSASITGFSEVKEQEFTFLFAEKRQSELSIKQINEAFFDSPLAIDSVDPIAVHLPSLQFPVYITSRGDSKNMKPILNLLKKPQIVKNFDNIFASIQKVLNGKPNKIYVDISGETEVKLDGENNLYINIKENEYEHVLAGFSEQIEINRDVISRMLNARTLDIDQESKSSIVAFSESEEEDTLFLILENSQKELYIREIKESLASLKDKYRRIVTPFQTEIEKVESSINSLSSKLMPPVKELSKGDRFIIFNEFNISLSETNEIEKLNFALLFNYYHQGDKEAIIDNPEFSKTIQNISKQSPPFSFQNHIFIFSLPTEEKEFNNSRLKAPYDRISGDKTGWERYSEDLNIWKQVLNQAKERDCELLFDPTIEDINSHLRRLGKRLSDVGLTFIGEQTESGIEVSNGIEIKKRGAFFIRRSKRAIYKNQEFITMLKEVNSVGRLTGLQLFSCYSKSKLANELVNKGICKSALAFNNAVSVRFAAYIMDKFIENVDGERSREQIMNKIQKELVLEIKEALKNPNEYKFRFSFGKEFKINELFNRLDEFPLLKAQKTIKALTLCLLDE